MRKLATIRKIAEIKPHMNADALELAIVDGWKVVVKKGEFKEGDMAVYFEIDSWVPDEIAPFLSKGKVPREYEGVKGERLKTIKLRGELSQGLLLPTTVLGLGTLLKIKIENGTIEGADVTDVLNIKKWEKPLNAALQGLARGNFPSFIRKTDQERIQNIFNKLTQEQREDLYEVTLKIDGSSTTYYVKEDEGVVRTGVCSRNLELKTDESNAGNSFVAMFNKLEMQEKLERVASGGFNLAFQGELWGSGINGNWEGIADHRFNVFDIYSIDIQDYCPADIRRQIVAELGLENVPLIEYTTLERFKTVDDFLEYADRASIHNKVAEGVVFKSVTNPSFSFKVINNKYLLNGGE